MALLTAPSTGRIRLRAVREAFGMSQAELSRKMGIDQSLVSRAERGKIEVWPRFRTLAAKALSVDEALLFGLGPDK